MAGHAVPWDRGWYTQVCFRSPHPRLLACGGGKAPFLPCPRRMGRDGSFHSLRRTPAPSWACALTTSPKPHHLPKAQPPNTVTLEFRPGTSGFGRDVHAVRSLSPAPPTDAERRLSARPEAEAAHVEKARLRALGGTGGQPVFVNPSSKGRAGGLCRCRRSVLVARGSPGFSRKQRR